MNGGVLTLLGVFQGVDHDLGVKCDVSDAMYIGHLCPWYLHRLLIVIDQSQVSSLDLIRPIHPSCLEVMDSFLNVTWVRPAELHNFMAMRRQSLCEGVVASVPS